MASITNYLKNKLVDSVLRGQAFTPPAQLYLALYSSATTDAGGGTELTGGNYARVAIAGSLAAWAGTQGAGTTTASTGTGGASSNNAGVNFPTPTASWGTPTHWALLDAATAGNMLLHNPITTPKAIASGAPVSFPAAAIAVTVSGV